MSNSTSNAGMDALRQAISSGSNAAAALSAMVAASRGSAAAASTTAPSAASATGSASSSTANEQVDQKPSAQELAKENEGQDDGHEVDDEISYTPYKPTKLKFGRDHPDPVVENATLAAVTPPDITYNLGMPAGIINEGKLSNLQLEAIVYGCQRHELDLPKPPPSLSAAASRPVKEKENDTPMEVDSKADVKPAALGDVKPDGNATLSVGGQKREPPALRAGFLLGDGAGMGKGRTLAGFVVENISRGRKRHVWISVSSDLYEDAKRDLRDLGMGAYAENNCYNLGKLTYGSLVSSSSSSSNKSKKKKGKKGGKKAKANTGSYDEGVMFSTYNTLIGKSRNGNRLDQLVEWCTGGGDPEEFDGLIMLDECHKAKTVDLDESGKAKNVGKNVKCSQTAAKVVELQALLPRARIVYCSATSVSEPKNLGFMSRLGLWGPGTEHPQGFNQFLKGLERLGTGAMELHAMHLKSTGSICARTLSYSACEFEMVEDVGDDNVRKVYNESSELWVDLHTKLADRCQVLKLKGQLDKRIDALHSRGDGVLSDDLLYHQQLHADSDDEDDGYLDSDDEEDRIGEQQRLRRKYRNKKPSHLKGQFWGSHQRFFRSLCIASKVDKAIELAKKAVNEDGHCCVIGLQSTGEARSKGAAKSSGINLDKGGAMDEFVSAPNEDLKRVIMTIFPLPPKPKGVIAPEFLNVLKNEDLRSGYTTDDASTASETSSTASGRSSRRARKNTVDYSELNIDNDGNDSSVAASNNKRKQKTTSKSNKKRRSSASGNTAPCSSDSDAESDFTIELSGDEDSDDDGSVFGGSEDEGEDNKNKSSKPSRKASRKKNSIPWNEIPLEASGLESTLDKADHERMVNYRKAAEEVQQWLTHVDKLNLPPNPLDRLLNDLGGPDEVAELTGRKVRQVKVYDAIKDQEVVILEKRKGDGPMDQINIEEKNHFQNGTKKIAILSEAASTGISLQADKRVKNQLRRLHITLELPWSADKAIQQLGRTHRSNQTSGPLYKFLISDVGGEKRFAAAVAKRLALLGALTQGDRRATGSANGIGLGSFDMDNQYGKKALKSMFDMIFTCSTVSMVDTSSDEHSKLFVEALKLIDEQLIAAIDGDDDNWEDNLVAYEARTDSEETRSMYWYSLLTGGCRRLSEDRVHAIKDGRSIPNLFESLGTGDKEEIKSKIDAELQKAKESGLNFNVLCNIWLYDVGVNRQDFKAQDVPRFLNRLLGMNLNRQKIMTSYFMTSLENEVMNAKRNNTYDVGIKTLTGNSLEFVGKPRTFCFRGLASKDDRVHLYTVAQDGGTSPETAMELYNEAKDDNNAPTSRGEWQRRGHRLEIVTGFYQDSRDIFRVTPKVFLIINPGAHSTKVSSIRPNTIRTAVDKHKIRERIMNGSLSLTPVREGMEIWQREFELSDIPISEKYQFSCAGRHRESHIFTGNIVPILNKMLASSGAGRSSKDEKEKKAYTVVRVDTAITSTDADDTEKEAAVEKEDSLLSSDTEDDEPEEKKDEASGLEMVEAEPLVGFDDVGLGIARSMSSKIGASSIFRGEITKYKDDDENEQCDPSGSFFVKLTDGSKLKMDADKANHARRLYEKEVHKLLSVGMPREDANNPLEIQTVAAQTSKGKVRIPVLEDGEDQDPENYEQIFEEEFDENNKVPDAIVGLMFKSDNVYFREKDENIECLLYEKVLKILAKKCITEGVESARQLHNLEKAERLADVDNASESMSEGEDEF